MRAARYGISILVALAAGIGVASRHGERSPPDAARLFAANCAICHGPEGRGDGPLAATLTPRPRNFTAAPLRYGIAGVPEDQVPSAIARTIARGLPRTAMPAFGTRLRPREIAALASNLAESSRPTRVNVPPENALNIHPPPADSSRAARGARLFGSLACWTCHGRTGRGDGPGAEDLLDSSGAAIRPADFTAGFKSGPRDGDIYRTIALGIPGTPMIGFRPMLTRRAADGRVDDEDIWALVEHVKALARASPTATTPP